VLVLCQSLSASFYIYYYIYIVKLVKFVYSLLIQILYDYKRATVHSTEKQVYRGQQIAER